MKTRADLLLVRKGLASSRTEAQALIMAGQVFAPGRRIGKSGELLPEDQILEVKERLPFVSRGGLKLDHALKEFHIDVSGKVCLDVGASTGGFTDCLLQRGAKKVYAVDVGYGQFHAKLRNDPRVVLMEKTNFRHINPSRIPEPIDLAAADVSFISLDKILPNLALFLKPSGRAVVLVKPQFELSPQEAGKGVVRSPELHEKAVRKVEDCARRSGFDVRENLPSPVIGPKGNREFLVFLSRESQAPPAKPAA